MNAVTADGWITIATFVCTIIIGLVAFLIRRSLSAQDTVLNGMASDMRQISSRVSSHAEALAAGTVRFSELDKRVEGLEERERARGCFGPCPTPTNDRRTDHDRRGG